MLEKIGKAAKESSYILQSLSTRKKNELLQTIASSLLKMESGIVRANSEDMQEARNSGLSSAMLDRLLLTPARLQAIAEDVLHVVTLDDPIGRIIDGGIVRSGLSLIRRRVPLGVVGVIYEARPNVTVDVATLCLKTSNAVILRGGRETAKTNAALVSCIQRALEICDLPKECVQFIESSDRALVKEFICLDKYVDMLIPRGGVALQKLCKEEATIPVILGGIGVCHIFVDSSANQEKSLAIIENAKVQRPSVCNSVETVLIHEAIAAEFFPKMAAHLLAKNVAFHGDESIVSLAKQLDIPCVPWQEEELQNEWLTTDLNLGIVADVGAALSHIRRYSSGHSDAILTECMSTADFFVTSVDSSAVYVNASTRFTDGGEFGLGAEVAVSTQKTHARGPMGLEALTSYKWIGHGNYLIRS